METELLRFELTLTKDHTNGKGHNRIDTFTWGATRKQAYARAAAIIDQDEWEGWSFTLADQPTKINKPSGEN